jgi:mannose/fructose-specific phosphotransferase system component IIA
MKKVLIITHGKFAEGIVSSVEIITGKQKNLHFINAYVDEKSVEEKLEVFLTENIRSDDYLIIFTDLFGGSVNQTVIRYLSDTKFNIIAGFNLPILLEVMMLDDTQLTPERLRQIVNDSREQIVYVNDELFKINEEDDLGF